MGKRSSPDAATERSQFVHLRLAQARQRSKPFDTTTVIKRAIFDWARKQRRERRRDAMTVRLDDLLNEPAMKPDPMQTLMSEAEVNFLLGFLTPQQRDVIASTFLARMTRSEVSEMLSISPQAVSETKRRAIDAMRSKGQK